MVFRFGLVIPWFGMAFAPEIPLFVPLIQLRFWQRIAQSPRDKYPRLALLPMGQTMRSLLDLTMRIEKGGQNGGRVF